MAVPQVIQGASDELIARLKELKGRSDLLLIIPAQDLPEPDGTPAGRVPSARELLRLSPEERGRILRAQAARAEEFYRNDPELTDFEAFGDQDSYFETR